MLPSRYSTAPFKDLSLEICFPNSHSQEFVHTVLLYTVSTLEIGPSRPFIVGLNCEVIMCMLCSGRT